MKSNWEILRQRSLYHFNNFYSDPKFDTVERIGTVEPFWNDYIDSVIKESMAVTWRTRGRQNDPLKRQDQEYDQEEYDLEIQGYGKDFVVTNLNYNVPDIFLPLINKFALDKVMSRIHVQIPGQVWNLHLDKLEKWMPEDPKSVVRYFIQLTDWEQGHFWSYGNYMYSGWHAGDITTFDWLNVPHSTANAGHSPRITLQLTGIATEDTKRYLATFAKAKD